MTRNYFENVTFACLSTEAATRGVPYKKLYLKISQYSQENTCVKSFFLGFEACNFIKKQL